MANPTAYQGKVLRNTAPTLMHRIVDSDNSAITQAALSTITYTVYLMSADFPDDPNTRTAVTGHEDAAVTIASSVFDTLQTGEPWDDDADASGFNFKHQIDISTNDCFAIAGRWYKVVFTATPVTGQVIRWEHNLYCE